MLVQNDYSWNSFSLVAFSLEATGGERILVVKQISSGLLPPLPAAQGAIPTASASYIKWEILIAANGK
jgi:hypothetical protein